MAKKTKQELVDAVIDDLKKGFEVGDYTVLEELLFFIPRKKLIQALPEEEWEKYGLFRKLTFEELQKLIDLI